MGKTYIPSDLLNSNWSYEFNDYYFTIHTYQNCFNQYNTTYCDCIRLYHSFDYQYSNRFSCSNNFTTSISYDNLTSDFWYRVDIDKSLTIFMILAIIIIFIPFKIIGRWFGRWLKV